MPQIKCEYKIGYFLRPLDQAEPLDLDLKSTYECRNKQSYVHLATHKKSPSLSDISWEVLHNHIQAFNTHKIVEALEIRKHENKIMNGCMGRLLSID